MILTCANCPKQVRRRPSIAGDSVFCSPACKSAALRKVKPDELREAALAGKTITAMSEEFQVNVATIRKWLAIDGLLGEWTRRRYKKCASQKVGPTSVTTASSEPSTPSSRSVALMAGGTSYGG